MTLNLGDPALDTRAPEKPPTETPPPRGSRFIPWWWTPVVILAIGIGILISALLLTGDDAEQTATLELQEEYATDSPLVIMEPGFSDMNLFIGASAELDPDVVEPSEWRTDSPLVIMEPGFSDMNLFVGGSAELDPEK